MPIVTIENAIIERIRATKLPYLRFVGSYGGELTGDWQAVMRALPAVWVTFKGMGAARPLDIAQEHWRAECEFSTAVAARSLRCEAATRHGHGAGNGGPGNEVGTYQMLDDVHALICMQDFALNGVDYLRPGRIRTLFNSAMSGQALSVLAQDWTTVCDYRLREPGQAAPPLHDSSGSGDSSVDGYLPPDRVDAVPDLAFLTLRYWLRPPQDMTTDPPMAEDRLSLNINI